jgi:hypothetical protein
MPIDKTIVYAKWAMEDLGAYDFGDYTYFSWHFEDDPDRRQVLTTDFCPIMVVSDLDALERYKDALAAYYKACADLQAVLVRPTEIPQLPPVPEGHRWANHDAWSTDTNYERECSVETCCNHWHAYVCRCEGKCTCHWSDDVPRPKSND